MMESRWLKVYGVSLLTMVLVVFTAGFGLAATGDPDGDGLPTLSDASALAADADHDGLLDGWEVFITGTDPADTDSNDGGIMDGQGDTDSDGISDGAELANGSNPLVANDDLEVPLPNSPLPQAPDYDPVQISRTAPADFTWGMTDIEAFVSYVLQFDGSPDFSTPVGMTYTPSASLMTTPSDAKWKLVTQQGRVVYWRVLGVYADGRKASSQINSFELTGGPAVSAPASGSSSSVGTRPAFSWKSGSRGKIQLW